MTKQEKVVAFMLEHGFKLSDGAEVWLSHQYGKVTHGQATFFYDVMVEAQEKAFRESERILVSFINGSSNYPAADALIEIREQLRHLKQEGKTNE